MTEIKTYLVASAGPILLAIQEPDYSNPEAIVAFAFHSTKPDLKTRLEIRFVQRRLTPKEETTIYIDGLWGNGDRSGLARKGVGTALVSSTLGLLMNSSLNCQKMIGKLHEDDFVKGEKPPESHYRRVRFWKRMGMVISDEEDMSSGMVGDLSNCTPVVPPQDFVKIQSHPHSPRYENVASLLPWRDSDQEALDKLISVIRSSRRLEQYEKLEAEQQSIEDAWSKQNVLLGLVRAIVAPLVLILPNKLLPKSRWEELQRELTVELGHVRNSLDLFNEILEDLDTQNFGLVRRSIMLGKFPDIPGLVFVRGHCCKLGFNVWRQVRAEF
ncbi:hypothetical protein MKR81_27205 (plasmid) [Vibrio campbellii]|uniref:hypothetical protein n=1 Tax=Vibrio campbellii TaxID=680 RepID=UPI001F074975|nr:hypothetical protein [Vibrio campbellii]UMM06638.1 hypothetical protein MKR81_27205 [Vibrio campbellii]